MSEQEPRALADLARAWKGTRHLFTNADEEASFDVSVMKTCEDGGVYLQESMDDEEQSSIYIPPEHLETVAKALWQAPPSPDAGAFEAAVSRVFAAAFKLGRLTARDHDLGAIVNANQEDHAARTALLAFAPGVRITATISESDVDAGAKALWKLVCGDDPQTDDDHAQTVETVRVVLEAVAAARQRATGSGVTGCGG